VLLRYNTLNLIYFERTNTMPHGLVMNRTDASMHPTLSLSTDIPLSDGNVTIDVHYSAINYKDALAVTNSAPVLRTFPIVPGIDLAGVVRTSNDPRWQVGDHVVIAGRGLGERRSGGYASISQHPGDIITRLPEGITLHDAMAIGTAGITAAMCVNALRQHNITPSTLPVLVTGATGGVGMHAINMLSQQGFRVTAVTGRPQLADMLKACGASDVIGRDAVAGPKPLEREQWAAVIDTVGGSIVSAAVRSTAYGGVVAMCGNAAGATLELTVYPFILRGIQLIGIDSVNPAQSVVDQAWNDAAAAWCGRRLAHMLSTIPLADVAEHAHTLMSGTHHGRTVVSIN
jgi:acrylyl-CoA reductase (NADPH)